MAVGPCCLRDYVLLLLFFILGVCACFLLLVKCSDVHRLSLFHFLTLLYSAKRYSAPNVTCFLCVTSSVTFLPCPFRLLPFLPLSTASHIGLYSPFPHLLPPPSPPPTSASRALSLQARPAASETVAAWVHGHHFPCLARLVSFWMFRRICLSAFFASFCSSLLPFRPFVVSSILSYVADVFILFWRLCDI